MDHGRSDQVDPLLFKDASSPSFGRHTIVRKVKAFWRPEHDDGREDDTLDALTKRRALAIIFIFLFLGVSFIAAIRPLCFSRAAVANHQKKLHSPLVAEKAVLDTRATSTSPLVDFQVYPPVLVPGNNGKAVLTDGMSNFPTNVNVASQGCVVQQTLMVYDFASSYGNPFSGPYTPPSCDFNRIVWNLTVTSKGVQYDRLGIAYFGSTELWRTSTAEPTPNGIVWTYIKDMSNYLSLFKEPQTLIFDIDNVVTGPYTGIYNATLTATFFTSEDTVNPADLILPVSADLGDEHKSSVFTVPPDTAASSLTLPRNVNKAIFTVSACGQQYEEFWYTNVFNNDYLTYGPGDLYPYSSFREVQVYIDGSLAGVAWPFPVIFTGGIVPGFWQPIVGIDAFDLQEREIDVTPWLPLLCDGKSHTFQIKVSGLNNTGNDASLSETNAGYWLVTGKVFLWLDPEGSITTGSSVKQSTPAPTFQISSAVTTGTAGQNNTLSNVVNARRQLMISSTVKTASGTTEAFWTQDLQYSNNDYIYDYGDIQLVKQATTGTDASSSGYAAQYSFPINTNITSISYPNGNVSIIGTIDRSRDIRIFGQPVFPSGLQSFQPVTGQPAYQGSSLQTRQNGSAVYGASSTGGYSYGTTEQVLTLSGIEFGSSTPSQFKFPPFTGSSELYQRHVLASNATVVSNSESMVGHTYNPVSQPASPALPDLAQKFLRPNIAGTTAKGAALRVQLSGGDVSGSAK